MSSKDENENDDEDNNEIIKILMHSQEYAETMNQNEKNIIKEKSK